MVSLVRRNLPTFPPLEYDILLEMWGREFDRRRQRVRLSRSLEMRSVKKITFFQNWFKSCDFLFRYVHQMEEKRTLAATIEAMKANIDDKDSLLLQAKQTFEYFFIKITANYYIDILISFFHHL